VLSRPWRHGNVEQVAPEAVRQNVRPTVGLWKAKILRLVGGSARAVPLVTMPVVAVGLSHRSAPISVLEQVCVPEEELGKALASLSCLDSISESVVVSTCMRTEVYAVAERFHAAVADVLDFLGSRAVADSEELASFSYSFHDAAAVAHLFRVSAGLDSAVLGESEVLGQVRSAWERAMAEGTSGPRLNALFRQAVEVGKRARSETAISRGVTSVPQAGVVVAASRMETPPERSRVVVVGSGTVGSIVASTVASSWRPSGIALVSRKSASAEELCQRLADQGYPGAVAFGLEELDRLLEDADVVFSATASPVPVIVPSTLRRRTRPVVVVDLAMPRDVDPAVGSLEGVVLLDMDAVAERVRDEMAGRASETERVGEIVAQEVARFVEIASARKVAPLVAELRSKAESIRGEEMERLGKRLAGLSDLQRSAVDHLTRSIVAKLLHEPTVRLKLAAGTPRGERLAESLRDLFDL
jgi:glutamyl-tRNA reductase